MPDGMGRLSADELREPNVTLVIPEDRAWQIPPEIMAELRLHGGRMVGDNWVVSIPAYLYRDFLRIAARLTD